MRKIILTNLVAGLLLFGCNQAGSSGSTPNQTNAATDSRSTEAKDSVSPYGPSRMVRNIKQARNGDILIASFTGVWRYDGKLFTNITSTIPFPGFWDVWEDRKGNLWFGSRDSGVYMYNGKSFQHFTKKDGLAGNSALHIYEDKAGNMWFGTGTGASRYDGKTFRNFTTKDGMPNDDINTFLEDKTGRLWIGTRDKACIYDGKTFTTIFRDGKPFINVWAIMEDQYGHIWLSDNDGLWCHDGKNYTRISERRAAAIIEDKDGNIWTTGSENDYVVNGWSLCRYDKKSLFNTRAEVKEIMSEQKMLSMIMEASDGSLWIGAMNGVFRYDGKTITDFKRKEENQ